MEGRQQCDEGTLRDAQRTASEDVRNRQAPGRRSSEGGRDGGGRGGRDGGRRGGPGGPGGRRGPGGPGPSGGAPRFQAGGHADSVSIGSDRTEPEAPAAPAAPAGS